MQELALACATISTATFIVYRIRALAITCKRGVGVGAGSGRGFDMSCCVSKRGGPKLLLVISHAHGGSNVVSPDIASRDKEGKSKPHLHCLLPRVLEIMRMRESNDGQGQTLTTLSTCDLVL